MSWEVKKITCTIGQKWSLFPNPLRQELGFKQFFLLSTVLGGWFDSAQQGAAHEDGVAVPETAAFPKHCFPFFS